MEGFHFDPVAHVYTLDGVVMPSVSALLKPIVDLSGIPPDVLAFAADRGTKVHKACHLYDLRQLDHESLDERLVPYVDAWAAFSARYTPTWTHMEEPMYHRGMWYAGTPDRVGFMEGEIVIPDIKATAQIMATGGVQLTGYAHLVEAFTDMKVDRLCVVQLRKDGTFKMQNFKRDDATFLSLVTINNWKNRNPK